MTQAEIFRGYMTAAWDGASDDNTHIYEEDAHIVANAMGAKPTASIKPDDDDGTPWLFPDGSTVNIMTRDSRGSGIV